MSIHRTKTGRYRVKWREGGQQRSKGFAFKIDAERFEAERRLGIAGADAAGNTPLTFGALAARWLAEHCDIVKAPSQRLLNRRDLELHVLPAWRERRLDSLTMGDGVTLRAAVAKGRSAKTVNNVMGLVKKILGDGARWGLLRENPLAHLRPLPLEEQRFDYWLAEERDRFLARCRHEEPELHDLIAVAVHTGLRLGELRGLLWDAVDLGRDVLTVKRSWCARTNQLRETTKSRKIRQVPLNAVAADVLRRRRGLGKGSSQPVFPPSQATLHPPRLLRRVAQLASVKPIRFHELRHTFASLLVMAGTDLVVVKELLGHADYKMVLRYAHLHPSRLKRSTDVLCSTPVPAAETKPASVQNISR